MIKHLEAVVEGRVQMVMYRDFVCRNARALGLRGTVRNLKDGTVEVVAQGEQEKLSQLEAMLHKGSALSRVDRVTLRWSEPSKSFNQFEIVYE